ncbi:hypothetical protein G6720_05435 [Polynucleobacter paneuropaeus]|nr:hypothetical protein G6720_05435 [Polynucleobacter paneuropaeus]
MTITGYSLTPDVTAGNLKITNGSDGKADLRMTSLGGGESCKIRPMIAYFSSKFTKQIHAALTAALLVFCLLGTHWVGLSHGISHAGFQKQSIEANASSNIDKSFNHSSDTCHLFDALSLAGFVPSSHTDAEVILISASDQQNSSNPSLRSLTGNSYHSRAPPTFIL